ncbi:DUF6894 family protein [Methylobacterium soli]|uniref:DUF6894 domain-containing protein n=1 Tax=Methylobacterium soli TaxID=553447 RepID=A0A6L3SNV8_9HYPH|nr:hypothetical protein [Methylobacterium soli]KAB1068512.1 hypothetical protein F6X53_31665 [Methylobacterium soli]GJE45845.1 hypothetical protein AEGHOMDF_5045 [Methylobacterium soli]
MPRYFFDILHDNEDVTRDHHGIDQPNLEAAEIEALEIWKRIIGERYAGAADPLRWHVVILNENGAALAKVPYPADLADGCDDERNAQPKRGSVSPRLGRGHRHGMPSGEEPHHTAS